MMGTQWELDKNTMRTSNIQHPYPPPKVDKTWTPLDACSLTSLVAKMLLFYLCFLDLSRVYVFKYFIISLCIYVIHIIIIQNYYYFNTFHTMT
jgi:hypothetical protein